MSRPRLRKCINFKPRTFYFKPNGIPTNKLEKICISSEELEAIHLKDYLCLSQNESAKKMEVSQPTFHRLLLLARKKISSAIIEGKAIMIENNNIEINNNFNNSNIDNNNN